MNVPILLIQGQQIHEENSIAICPACHGEITTMFTVGIPFANLPNLHLTVLCAYCEACEQHSIVVENEITGPLVIEKTPPVGRLH